VIDANLLVVLGLFLVLAGVAWLLGGSELVWRGVSGGGGLLARYAALIAVSFLAAGLAEVLVPTQWVREALGRDSGLRGILLASAAGAVTPAGPFVSMPIAAVMLKSGAGAAPVVAFLTAWSLIALHRLVAWEIPVLGLQFALLRYAVCLALPVAAGLLARAALR
jgi:uncharacterized membrane protein YraQ (UPF0718 family)